MAVEFQPDVEKVIAVVVYIASKKVPELTPGKLFKLMFLADKHHLVQYGRPITGDRYNAMKDGPVPSLTYDLFKRQIMKTPFSAPGRQLASKLAIDRGYELPRISSQGDFDHDQLSKSDIASIDKILDRYRNCTFAQLRALTHDMIAYENAWKGRRKKESVPMKFEDFFEEDEDAIVGTKDEVIENHILNTVFAKR